MKKNIYKKVAKRARKKESLSGDVIVNTVADASKMTEWESILLDDEHPAAKSFLEQCKDTIKRAYSNVTDDHNPGT